MDKFSVNILKGILVDVVKKQSASVHFSVGYYPILRIDGEMSFLEIEKTINSDFIYGLSDLILSEEQKKVLQTKKEIILTYQFDRDLRFKVTIFYQKGLLSATLRHIPSQLPPVSGLGLDPIISSLLKIENGLVLISGSFGSGRSTTVATVIEEINRTKKKYIITIEDPIEHIFTNKKSIIEQREVGKDTRSFFEAVNYFQEEDADVLYLEEIRDASIIPMILEVAGGSSLVLTTVSAGSVVQALSNVLSNFQSFDQERIRNLLASSLKVVICQKLIPRIGGGLVPVYEILFNTEAVKSIILSGDLRRLNDIIQTSRNDGMLSFDQSLVERVKAGKITDQDAISGAVDSIKMVNSLK